MLTIAALAQFYAVASWWSEGDSFGNRMLLDLTVLFGLGLMALVQALAGRPAARRAVLASWAGLVLWNAALAGLYCFRIVGNSY